MLLIHSLGAVWAWWSKQFHTPKCGPGHVCRVMAWARQQGLVPYIGFGKVRGDLCIYRCVPPTHEYGTRPFLRWARSQGRSPQASGKAKNTFGPFGIPLFGAPQAPGNNPPQRGYKPWGMAPWGRRNSPVPRHIRQNRPEIKRPTECNPTTGEEKKVRGDLWIFRRRSLFYMKEREHYLCRAT